MFKKVTFIINPIFGINRNPNKIIAWIEEAWKDSGVDYRIVKTKARGHGTELAREAAQNGSDLVVAAGGDGTINEVGRGLLESDAVLGIIPAGSGNGFARNVKIPLNQRKAIQQLRNPALRKIDVGKINRKYFFNVAGVGLDAQISMKFDQSTLRGPVPYFVAGVREFLNFSPETVSIRFGDTEIQRAPMLLSFANLPEFGVNATIAPNAKPDDGLIDLCILQPVKFHRAVINLPKLFNGQIDQLPEMEIYQVPKAEILRSSDGPIHTDGDPHQESARLSIEVLPRAITIAVPR